MAFHGKNPLKILVKDFKSINNGLLGVLAGAALFFWTWDGFMRTLKNSFYPQPLHRKLK